MSDGAAITKTKRKIKSNRKTKIVRAKVAAGDAAATTTSKLADR